MKNFTALILIIVIVGNINAQSRKKANKLVEKITDEICKCLESKKNAKYIYMDDPYSDCVYRIVGIYENEIDSFIPEPEKFYDEELSDEFYKEIYSQIYFLMENKDCEFVFDENLELAEEYYFDGDYQEAIEHYIKVPETLMDFDAYNYLGISLFRIGKREEAIENFVKARELKPFDSTIHGNIAYVFFHSGDSLMVLQSLDAASQFNNRENYYYKYAGYYKDFNNYYNAELLYQKAIEVFPDSINSYLELIDIYSYRLIDSAKLMNVLKGAYLLDSTNEVVLEKYRSKYIAWGDCEMAAYYNNKYYEAIPDGSSYGYYRIASCYYDAENYTEAKKYFQKYSSLQEDANNGNFGLVRCERKLQNYDESLEIINKMIEADSTEYYFYERALTFVAMGDYESAIDDLTTIIEFDPCNCEYYEKRAEYYEKLNMNDLAARDREIMEILFCGKLDEFYYYDN